MNKTNYNAETDHIVTALPNFKEILKDQQKRSVSENFDKNWKDSNNYNKRFTQDFKNSEEYLKLLINVRKLRDPEVMYTELLKILDAEDFKNEYKKLVYELEIWMTITNPYPDIEQNVMARYYIINNLTMFLVRLRVMEDDPNERKELDKMAKFFRKERAYAEEATKDKKFYNNRNLYLYIKTMPYVNLKDYSAKGWN